ncbi:hypothetical protein [Azospirillum doebereinerae]|uniref:Glutelin n=1 Tax=Azospirillum doebereinerae TaxID=92933 RepID=A0A3S0V3P9_9PROT|nr:hypothetical protein [Azospirillum doebereinerae]MCG5243920.1 hypothetical protein [Azospirillum doebereinerae]RUQ65954.1 hypothetical protein EJ913_24200 [Azospirillum doebereinerae]
MSGRFGNALKAVALGALVAGSMLGAGVGTAAAHDDWRGGRGYDRGYDRGWEDRGREWRGERHHRGPPPRHWREPRVIYAPPPVVYAPPPPPRVIYAQPPVVYAPSPGFGFSVNIR